MTEEFEQLMGEFRDGKSHGKGKFYYVNGQKYTGDWIDDKKDGKGVYTWPNGNRYESSCSVMFFLFYCTDKSTKK